MLNDGGPIFSQVAEKLADEIADGQLSEGDRVPSTNDLASFYRINPATAAKGLNVLIAAGLLEKRRGIGMFVAEGARARMISDRRRLFVQRFVEPMAEEAERLGLDADTLGDMIRSSLNLRGGVTL
jgi:GntR family transcriptional regulator